MGQVGALEHRAIVDALRMRDAAAAKQILEAHIGRTAQRVAEQ